MEAIDHLIGATITGQINTHKTTPHKLSAQAGIPYTSLHRKLNGHSSFTARELYRIATALEVSVTELVKDAA